MNLDVTFLPTESTSYKQDGSNTLTQARIVMSAVATAQVILALRTETILRNFLKFLLTTCWNAQSRLVHR